MRTPDNPPPVHLQRISILIPGQHLFRQCTWGPLATHEHTALSQGLLGPERAENKPG